MSESLSICRKFGEYPKYCNFKQRIIKPAIEEINKVTDLYCEFEEVKEKIDSAKIKAERRLDSIKEKTKAEIDSAKIKSAMKLEEAAKKLLANPVMEVYEITVS